MYVCAMVQTSFCPVFNETTLRPDRVGDQFAQLLFLIRRHRQPGVPVRDENHYPACRQAAKLDNTANLSGSVLYIYIYIYIYI